jgi:hypothetical protein
MPTSLRPLAYGALALLALAGAMALALMLSSSNTDVANAQSSGSIPASKAAVAVDELIALSQTAGADAGDPSDAGTTGWVDVLETQIKTSQQKDLNIIAALQTGVVTDNTVSSKNGGLSSSTARGTVSVRVLVDDDPAEPDNSIDANKATAPGVVYQDRIAKLEARFSGLNCTADLETGAVTCEDPEMLRLLMKSLNANSFNFVKMDVGSGVHTVTVQAKADAAADIFQDDPFGGTLAGAEAFTGAGSVLVEEVRYVKGTDPIVDLE